MPPLHIHFQHWPGHPPAHRLVKILERPAVQQFAPFQRLLESAIVVGYVFQFSGRSRDRLEDHAELVWSKYSNALG